MPIAYHIDRTLKLKEGQNLILDTNFVFNDGLNQDFIKNFLPSGVSKHGEQYLKDVLYYYYQPNFYLGVYEATDALSMYITEYTFELIRRTNYSSQPSRFQSIFALPSLKSIESWPELETSSYQIFEIEYDQSKEWIYDGSYLLSGLGRSNPDDPFLMQGFSACLNFEYANKYWKHEHSPDPKPEIILPLPQQIGKRIYI
jgi:hypothetical protein